MQALQSFTPSHGTCVSPQYELLPETRSVQGSYEQEWSNSMIERVGLVHDVRNLLHALNLYADLLAIPGVLSESYRDYASELKIISERSNSIIERLARHNRTFSYEEETTILPQILNGCINLMSRVIERPIRYSFTSDALLAVSVPGEIVERILLNLLKNAAKATPVTGTISVLIEKVDHKNKQLIVMRVEDDGAGMNKFALEKSFIPIPRSEGHGWGLRAVRDLVARSGGQIEIDTRPGRGTKVSVGWISKTA